MSERILLTAMIIGHTSFFALVINVSHGVGIKSRSFDRAVRYALLVLVVATLVGGFWIATHPISAWPGPLCAYAMACLGMALIAVPAATLVRACRKPPAGITGRSTELDLACDGGAEAFIGEGAGAWLLRLPGNESFRLECREWEVEIPGLPRSLDGLSLVQITDLHFSTCYRRRFFETVINEAAGWEADLVVFTGDLIDEGGCREWIEPVFSRMAGRMGQFAILGNHDYRHDTALVSRELEAAGFEVIDGFWSALEIDGTTLAIGGTSYPWGRLPDPATIPAADFRLLLSHTPDLLYRASSWDVDLMLSGHNHGGQVRLPIVGPVLMPSRFSRRFDHGFFRHHRTLLYVGRGVGGEQPFRYGAPPEITRFVLHPAGRRCSVSRPRSRSRSRSQGDLMEATRGSAV